MFNDLTTGLATKLAMRKMGISKDTFNFTSTPAAKPSSANEFEDEGDPNSNWPKWMSVRKLPLTAQAWLAPPPPSVAVATECPRIGGPAPVDGGRQLDLTLSTGRRQQVLVVFLRCVGCAFAQKTFLALRELSTRYRGQIQCIAVSHSSAAATNKWIDLLGGRWNVEVIIDEDRAIYAAWGLGLGSTWYYMNPTTQIQSWKEKGWLGNTVATSIQRTGRTGTSRTGTGLSASGAPAPMVAEEVGPTTVMGNKWQESGAWAVNANGNVVWGGKAARADEIPDLDAGIRALGLARA